MQITVATLNEILLPPFLFLVSFCFLCCLLYKPGKTSTFPATPQLSQDKTTPTATQHFDEPIAIEEVQETNQEQEPAVATVTDEFLLADRREVPAIEEPATPDPIAFLESQIDLNKLSLRACRAIAGKLTSLDSYRLGISQKVNGHDKPAAQLVAEVRNRLKKDPATVAPVIWEFANPTALLSQDETLAESQAQAIAS
jgi:hypothetical protein